LQAEQLHQSGTKLEDQAKAALGQNREDLAREALTRLEAVKTQLRDLATQRDQLQAEEAKLTSASSRLEGKVQAFRVRKETIKATYTAAEAQAKIGEAMSGMSEEMGDVGLAVQRAEDKTAQLQARAGAIDELMASGALDDASQSNDSIQAELDKVGAKSSVDAELARLKAEVGGPALDAQSKSAS
ncbi:MAG: PspA/IM30 family protein, partial [Candidatus Limnocylindria bacterium]